MTQLKISEAKARQMYPSAPQEWKEVLIESFGKDFFSRKITDRIKTFSDVLWAEGVAFFNKKDDETEDEYGYRQLKLVAKVLNEDWIPDYTNSKQPKYTPWFEVKSDGSLVFDYYYRWSTTTIAGSRLCFRSAELAEYAGRTFLNIYSKFLM